MCLISDYIRNLKKKIPPPTAKVPQKLTWPFVHQFKDTSSYQKEKTLACNSS